MLADLSSSPSAATYTGQWRPVAVLSTEDAGEERGMQVDK